MDRAISALAVMGVAGCGKSCVGAAIAVLSEGRLIEGDAFHPPANIAKMSAGAPLTDEDRAGWLDRLGEELVACLGAGERPVLTCSALKKRYRDTLRHALPGLGFVYLELTPEVAAARVANRPGHFMPASLIKSQFDALEPPHREAATLTLDATLPLEILAERASQWWRASNTAGGANSAQPERGETYRSLRDTSGA
ncbi:gluconokinase [Methylocella silvestris]|uniref:Gluconokinase n=1 Tax=Methylocella silvestris TaxID=199596 RepID=A0A2J7TFE3_METSI|nr:gluconokinase [Methylocella silvestris]PNG25491.1 gluconokinase [Methylocella silvestris]